MSWSFMWHMFNWLAVIGYGCLLVYYFCGGFLVRDLVWRTFSRTMLPGIALAWMISLLCLASHLLLDIHGYTTIWWPNAPAI